jgi:hypothetical protein
VHLRPGFGPPRVRRGTLVLMSPSSAAVGDPLAGAAWNDRLPAWRRRKKTTGACFPPVTLSHMTGGPGSTRGPTCRFKKVVAWVCFRVHLAYLGLGS